jgi:hypothetical protein
MQIYKHWHLGAVYTLTVTTYATGVIPHTLHIVLKRLDLPNLLYVPIQKSVILSTCNINCSWVVVLFGNSQYRYLRHLPY